MAQAVVEKGRTCHVNVLSFKTEGTWHISGVARIASRCTVYHNSEDRKVGRVVMAMLHHEAGSDLGDELAYITVDQPFACCAWVCACGWHPSMAA